MATTYTLADLLSPETADDALDVLLTDLAAQGFPTTAWDDFDPIGGSCARTLARSRTSCSSSRSPRARARRALAWHRRRIARRLALAAREQLRAEPLPANVRAPSATVSVAPTASPYTLTEAVSRSSTSGLDALPLHQRSRRNGRAARGLIDQR